MEILALLFIIVAIVLFCVVAFQSRPGVNLTALGLAFFAAAVMVWHIVGGLEPLID